MRLQYKSPMFTQNTPKSTKNHEGTQADSELSWILVFRDEVIEHCFYQ